MKSVGARVRWHLINDPKGASREGRRGEDEGRGRVRFEGEGALDGGGGH